MLDIGGWEFLVVAFVLVMVVGPKELPKMLRGFTGIMRQIGRAANEFTSSMTDLANEADMADLKKTLDQAKSGNLDEIADAIDPTGGVGETVDSLKDSIGKDAAGDDVKDIGTIAKVAGDEMAAATKSPEAEPAKANRQKGEKARQDGRDEQHAKNRGRRGADVADRSSDRIAQPARHRAASISGAVCPIHFTDARRRCEQQHRQSCLHLPAGTFGRDHGGKGRRPDDFYRAA